MHWIALCPTSGISYNTVSVQSKVSKNTLDAEKRDVHSESKCTWSLEMSGVIPFWSSWVHLMFCHRSSDLSDKKSSCLGPWQRWQQCSAQKLLWWLIEQTKIFDGLLRLRILLNQYVFEWNLECVFLRVRGGDSGDFFFLNSPQPLSFNYNVDESTF